MHLWEISFDADIQRSARQFGKQRKITLYQ